MVSPGDDDSARGRGFAKALPLAMFLVFAVFWTGYDLKLGIWLASLPTFAVATALLLRVVLKKQGGAS